MTERTLAEPDLVEVLIAFMLPVVTDILQRIDAEEFTTTDFIAVLRTDAAADTAYQTALRRWGEDERRAKMVIHGQVIPVAMRRSGLAEWQGYAHGEDDQYAVPAWWRLNQAPGARRQEETNLTPDA